MFSTNTKNIYEFKDSSQVLITQEQEFINLFQNKCKPYYFWKFCWLTMPFMADQTVYLLCSIN